MKVISRIILGLFIIFITFYFCSKMPEDNIPNSNSEKPEKGKIRLSKDRSTEDEIIGYFTNIPPGDRMIMEAKIDESDNSWNTDFKWFLL